MGIKIFPEGNSVKYHFVDVPPEFPDLQHRIISYEDVLNNKRLRDKLLAYLASVGITLPKLYQEEKEAIKQFVMSEWAEQPDLDTIDLLSYVPSQYIQLRAKLMDTPFTLRPYVLGMPSRGFIKAMERFYNIELPVHSIVAALSGQSADIIYTESDLLKQVPFYNIDLIADKVFGWIEGDPPNVEIGVEIEPYRRIETLPDPDIFEHNEVQTVAIEWEDLDVALYDALEVYRRGYGHKVVLVGEPLWVTLDDVFGCEDVKKLMFIASHGESDRKTLVEAIRSLFEDKANKNGVEHYLNTYDPIPHNYEHFDLLNSNISLKEDLLERFDPMFVLRMAAGYPYAEQIYIHRVLDGDIPPEYLVKATAQALENSEYPIMYVKALAEHPELLEKSFGVIAHAYSIYVSLRRAASYFKPTFHLFFVNAKLVDNLIEFLQQYLIERTNALEK